MTVGHSRHGSCSCTRSSRAHRSTYSCPGVRCCRRFQDSPPSEPAAQHAGTPVTCRSASLPGARPGGCAATGPQPPHQPAQRRLWGCRCPCPSPGGCGTAARRACRHHLTNTVARDVCGVVGAPAPRQEDVVPLHKGPADTIWPPMLYRHITLPSPSDCMLLLVSSEQMGAKTGSGSRGGCSVIEMVRLLKTAGWGLWVRGPTLCQAGYGRWNPAAGPQAAQGVEHAIAPA